MDTLDPGIAPAPVAAMPPARADAPWRKPLQLALLVATPLLVLAFASVTAWALVRLAADWRLGIDSFIDERARPRLSLYELALRGVAVDVVRQAVIALCAVGIAIWCDGAAWRRRLGLARPAEPRRPFPRPWLLALFLLVWPAIHIAWVSGTAQVLHVGFGQGMRLSPYLTTTLTVWWFAYVALLAPAAEELLIRGEVFARASGIMRPAGAIVTTALLFCILHLTEMGIARPITLLPLAITLGWLRWRTGRLWPCILLHAWSNTALLTYLLWPIARWS